MSIDCGNGNNVTVLVIFVSKVISMYGFSQYLYNLYKLEKLRFYIQSKGILFMSALKRDCNTRTKGLMTSPVHGTKLF